MTATFAYPPMRVHFGAGAVADLDAVLGNVGVDRVMVVCGANVASSPDLLERVADASGGRVVEVFAGVVPHPPMGVVDEAAARFRSSGCGAAVSVGGGSAHDCARAMVLCADTGRPMAEHFVDPSSHFWRYDGPRPKAPVVAVPTTLSAAETGYGGSVTDPVARKKYVFSGPAFYIEDVLLDREIFATTPIPVLLASGLNALDHAVERLMSPACTRLAEGNLLHAVRLLVPNLRRLHDDPTDADALDACIAGAHLSVTMNVMSGLNHAIAHVLGGRYRVEHGVANAVILPHGTRYNGDVAVPALSAIAAVLRSPGWEASAGTPAIAHVVADHLLDLVASLGLPTRLRDVGIERDDLPIIADEVQRDISAPHSAKRLRSPDDVLAVLEAAW